MSQHDFDIANQSAPTFRSDLNAALKALASSSSGATAPATTFANMLWYDSGNNALKQRTEADDGWIIVSYFDTGAGKVRVPEGTEIYDGTDVVAALKVHDDSVWVDGADTNKRLVSPFQIAAAIAEKATHTKVFKSSDTLVIVNSSRTIAHNLGVIPSLSQLIMRCVGSEGVYSINDEVVAPSYYSSGGIQHNALLRSDAVNFYIQTGSTFRLANNSGGTFTPLPARWRFVVRAWA